MSSAVAERYRGERVDLYGRVPYYARRILLIGSKIGILAALLQKRPDTRVFGVERSAADTNTARAILASQLYPDLPSLVAQEAGTPFDLAIVVDPVVADDAFTQTLGLIKPVLGPFGSVMVLSSNPGFWQHAGTGNGAKITAIGEAARIEDFHTYRVDTVDDAGFLRAAKNAAGGAFTFGGTDFSSADPEEVFDRACQDFVLELVRSDHNPIEHAHALLEAGDPGGSFEVLDRIPAPLREDPTTHTVVNTEMMICLLRWQQQDPEQSRIDTLARAQELFYAAVAREPHFIPAYRCQAEFWLQAGDADMAARLLRSVLRAAPDAEAEEQLAAIAHVEASALPDDRAPAWDAAAGPRRVLFITHPRPHYGLDVLYDGLCRELGPAAVVDFPWKATLHGERPEAYKHYPCNFDWPGDPLDEPVVIAELRASGFDAVLWGDCEGSLPATTAKAIAEAAGDTPIYIVDQVDEFVDLRARVEATMGRPAAAYFKREMLACVDYGVNAFPLPFAYPDVHVPAGIAAERPHEIFWAGHRSYGLRQLYLPQLEALLDTNLSETFDQAAYAERLDASRIGLNFFGYGFDTVRYWELPAHGALLLAERLPIRIPHNFEDGVSAVYFDDLPDLEAKLQALREDTARVARIAAAGHAHFKRHHTGAARARQLLGWIQGLAQESSR